jgi:hypothetical protein
MTHHETFPGARTVALRRTIGQGHASRARAGASGWSRPTADQAARPSAASSRGTAKPHVSDVAPDSARAPSISGLERFDLWSSDRERRDDYEGVRN